MTALLAAIAAIAIALIVRSWRVRPFVDDSWTVPQTDSQRRSRWDNAAKIEWGIDTEERLYLQIKGVAAKRRLLAESRNRAGKALARVQIATQPAAEPVPLITKRPRLTLAR